MRKWRQYLPPIAITVGVFALGATAFAVSGRVSGPEIASDSQVESHGKADATETAEANETETATDSETAGGPNHGHCVSYWAHKAKAEGLTGKSFGAFISTVAQNDSATSSKVTGTATPDGTCNFQAALDAAKLAQPAANTHSNTGTHGKSSQNKGKSGSHTPDPNETDND